MHTLRTGNETEMKERWSERESEGGERKGNYILINDDHEFLNLHRPIQTKTFLFSFLKEKVDIKLMPGHYEGKRL